MSGYPGGIMDRKCRFCGNTPEVVKRHVSHKECYMLPDEGQMCFTTTCSCGQKYWQPAEWAMS